MLLLRGLAAAFALEGLVILDEATYCGPVRKVQVVGPMDCFYGPENSKFMHFVWIEISGCNLLYGIHSADDADVVHALSVSVNCFEGIDEFCLVKKLVYN